MTTNMVDLVKAYREAVSAYDDALISWIESIYDRPSDADSRRQRRDRINGAAHVMAEAYADLMAAASRCDDAHH